MIVVHHAAPKKAHGLLTGNGWLNVFSFQRDCYCPTSVCVCLWECLLISNKFEIEAGSIIKPHLAADPSNTCKFPCMSTDRDEAGHSEEEGTVTQLRFHSCSPSLTLRLSFCCAAIFYCILLHHPPPTTVGGQLLLRPTLVLQGRAA